MNSTFARTKIKLGTFIVLICTVSHKKFENDVSFIISSPPLIPGVKRSGREADHSPPSSAKVRNAWSYIFLSQYVFMAWCLVKYDDNFTFTYVCLKNGAVPS
jgi:hypothetical protein